VVAKLQKGEAVSVVGEVDLRYLVAASGGKLVGLVPREALDVKHTAPEEPK
jgi:hypothetical protein